MLIVGPIESAHLYAFDRSKNEHLRTSQTNVIHSSLGLISFHGNLDLGGFYGFGFAIAERSGMILRRVPLVAEWFSQGIPLGTPGAMVSSGLCTD